MLAYRAFPETNLKSYFVTVPYYHRDEQFSTAFIIGRDGEIQNGYLYDAFGAELETDEQFQNRIHYTGQQYDDLTEQYYLRARYYNPVLGRFMQEDVYQGDGLNLYVYCGNNPVMYWDPSGYSGEGEGYIEPKPGSGCFVSADGTRVFRMGENDILGDMVEVLMLISKYWNLI